MPNTTYKEDLLKLTEGLDPEDLRQALTRHLDDIKREKAAGGVTDLSIEDLQSKVDRFQDDTRLDYQISPAEKYQRGLVRDELIRRERVEYVVSQKTSMDKTAYLTQEARRIEVVAEMETIHAQYGGTLIEQRARTVASAKLAKELAGMTTPDQLTVPAPPAEDA